jgi:general secretion pathway protein I
LLEILIALVFISLALSAIVRSATMSVTTAAHLRDKTLAHWVAMNKVVEFQLQKEWPSVGVRKGEMEMANHDWYWEAKVSQAFDQEDLRRFDVAVFRERGDKSSVATMVIYVEKPS